MGLLAFCRLSVDNLPHSPYNTNAYAMFVDVSVYEEYLWIIFEKCERRSGWTRPRSWGFIPHFHALRPGGRGGAMEGKRRYAGSNNYLA